MRVGMSFIVAFITTLLLVVVLKRVSPFLGILDTPGGHKNHNGSVPLVGGLAIFGGLLLSSVVASIEQPMVVNGVLSSATVFWVCASLLVLVGAWDDKKGLPVRIRIAAQIIAVGLMVALGEVAVETLGNMFADQEAVLGYWVVPVTLIGVVGGINAMNMVDGIDGLAGTLAMITVAALVYLVMRSGAESSFSHLVLMSLGGAIIAFLVFNLSVPGRTQATVFLGDAGSMLLGFVLAWLMTDLSQGKGSVMDPVTALWIFAAPLYDAVGNMLRRFYVGKSPFGADREHIHHLLLEKGLTVSQVVFIISLFAVMMAMIGVIGYVNAFPQYLMFYGFLALFGIYVLTVEHYWRGIKEKNLTYSNISVKDSSVQETP